MKRVLFTILGMLAGSALAWAGLLSWAAFSLNLQDSLFDRDPQALNLFLSVWVTLAVMGAVAGFRVFRTKS